MQAIFLPKFAMMLRGYFLFFLIGSGVSLSAQPLHSTFADLVPGVQVHTSYRMLGDLRFPSNGLIVHTRDSVVLIDTGWGIEATREVLEELGGRPVAACIVTHFHDDRTGGIPLLREEGIACWGSARTRALALANGEAPPDARLLDDSTFTIDGLRLSVFFPGAGHTPDNMVVWLPDQQVLFGGCFVKSTESRSLGNTADAALEEWPRSMERLRSRFPEALHVVPGHQQWGGAELLEHTLQLLRAR